MSTFDIAVELDVAVADDVAAALEAAALATLRQQQVDPPAALVILLTDDDIVQDLNATYRGYDEPTDVLSFGAEDDEGIWPPGEPRHLGDIAISVPQAARQAAQGGHALLAELQLLTVHGVLHLLGHDHETADDKAAMWAAQQTILTALGAAITGPASDE